METQHRDHHLPELGEGRFQISVVISTYNRLFSLRKLLDALKAQTLPPEQFEVVVVDDGSETPVDAHLKQTDYPYTLTLVTQENTGQAAARHAGIREAGGDIIVIVDDDMGIPAVFLEKHLEAHRKGARVVLGDIRPADDIADRPVFERFHAYQFDRFKRRMLSGKPAKGNFWTGNVSVRKRDYDAVGGFDPHLRRSEDKELGIRLEQLMSDLGETARIWSEDAFVIHYSDHDEARLWLNRAFNYGVYDYRIGKKHDDLENADPWSFIFKVNPISRILFIPVVVSPNLTRRWGERTLKLAEKADGLGREKLAISMTTLAYGLQYFRGVREESTGLAQTVDDFTHYLQKTKKPTKGAHIKNWLSASVKLRARLKKDIDRPKRRFEIQHDGARTSTSRVLLHDIGLQLMVGVRCMQFLRDTNQRTASQIVSRMLRHLFGADIHPDAAIAPGAAFIHGNGIVIGGDVSISEGCLIFQNVTLGEGRDKSTGRTGSPVLGKRVHVGPGSTLVGPIEIGAHTKFMAGSVVDESLPPYTLVRPARQEISQRRRSRIEDNDATDG